MATRLPPLLEPYLSLPPEFSLTLLTGVLGATTNWLLLRHLAAYLGRHPSQGGGSAEEGEDAGSSEAYVLLISFMRDITFWREGAARLVRRPPLHGGFAFSFLARAKILTMGNEI